MMSHCSAGFGDSSGCPTTDRSVASDAAAVYRWILKRRTSADSAADAEGVSETHGPAEECSHQQVAAGTPVIIWGHSLDTEFVVKQLDF